MTGYIPRWFIRPQTVTHPSIVNPAVHGRESNLQPVDYKFGELTTPLHYTAKPITTNTEIYKTDAVGVGPANIQRDVFLSSASRETNKDASSRTRPVPRCTIIKSFGAVSNEIRSTPVGTCENRSNRQCLSRWTQHQMPSYTQCPEYHNHMAQHDIGTQGATIVSQTEIFPQLFYF